MKPWTKHDRSDRVAGISRLLAVAVAAAWACIPCGCDSSAPQPGESEMTSQQGAGGTQGPFTLEYSVVGLEELGDGLRRIDTRLVIDSGRKTVTLETHRSQSDQPGEPIGLFRGALTEGVLRDVLAKVYAARLGSFPPPSGGGIGATEITLRFQHGQTKAERTFSSRDMAALEQAEQLLFQLDQLSGEALKGPVTALRPSVRYERKPQPHFVLALTNIGTEPICIADPRRVEMDVERQRWVGVKVAEVPESRPGYTAPPPEWKIVLLAGGQESAQETLTLASGESLTLATRPWTSMRKNAEYIAIGVFSDYTGPATADDVYRVRGASFSEALTFKAD